MDGRPQLTFAFPRPGRALKIVLGIILLYSIANALLYNYAHFTPQWDYLICEFSALRHFELWRLVTSGVVTSHDTVRHIIYTLIGLYFFSPDLEKSWGPRRFVVFLALSVAIGNLTVLLVRSLLPGHVEMFHEPYVYGAGAAITSVIVAWSRENAHRQAFFLLFPLPGWAFFWVAVALAVALLIYPDPVPEGRVGPLSGVLTGLLFGGTPSVARRLYLRAKLLFLRRRLRSEDLLDPQSQARPKPRSASSAPLRVVKGGLEDVLRKRKPPKDKRYLN
jgi:membrane associated rhomboid family serine protease